MERYSALAGVDIIQKEHREWGQTYAQTIQGGLKDGESFEEMEAPSPEEAMRLAQDEDARVASFWKGYLSRWD